MATSTEDILLSEAAFIDVYALSSTVVGSNIIIQNKSPEDVLLVISATQPPKSFNTGTVLKPYDMVQVDAGEVGLWAITTNAIGRISVQIP